MFLLLFRFRFRVFFHDISYSDLIIPFRHSTGLKSCAFAFLMRIKIPTYIQIEFNSCHEHKKKKKRGEPTNRPTYHIKEWGTSPAMQTTQTTDALSSFILVQSSLSTWTFHFISWCSFIFSDIIEKNIALFFFLTCIFRRCHGIFTINLAPTMLFF